MNNTFIRLFLIFITLLIVGQLYFIFPEDGFTIAAFLALFVGGISFITLGNFPRRVFPILITGFLIRFFMAFLSYTEIWPQEGSLSDALYFLEKGEGFYEGGGAYMLENFSMITGGLFYPAIIATFFLIFAPHIIIPIFFNIFIGLFNIYLGYKIGEKIRNQSLGVITGWIVALFPYMIMYSVVLIREELNTFFICLAVYNFLVFHEKGNFKSFFQFNIFGLLGAMLHGGVIGVFLVNAIALFFSYFKNKKTAKIKYMLLLPMLVGVLLMQLLLGNFKIYKLEYLALAYQSEQTDFSQTTLNNAGHAHKENTYRGDIQADNFVELAAYIPVLVFQFIFEPLPHRLTSVRYPTLYISSFFYLVTLFLIITYRKRLRPFKFEHWYLLAVLFSIYILYAVGSSQYSQAIRHLRKPFPIFIALFVPVYYYFFKEISSSYTNRRKSI